MLENEEYSLSVGRGDALMMYATSSGSYTVRLHFRLDGPIVQDAMQRALDKTAKRYPYFCVTLKKNEREFYYERNDAPVALLHTDEMITLGTKETNGHIWAVSFNDDNLYLNFFHGRADGTGIYFLAGTLLYYYFHEVYGLNDSTGIRTLETPITKEETADPYDALPLIDLSKFQRPPVPEALNMMGSLGLKRGEGKGYIRKLSIPEDVMVPFIRENDATPGILVCVLMARAIERVLPDHTLPIVNSYVINSRPMLNARESFHNATERAALDFSDSIKKLPLDMQCTAYRGKTILQSDEDMVRNRAAASASISQMVLNLPDFDSKVQAARRAMGGFFKSSSYVVSYVGRWAYPKLGEHIREFWTETPTGEFPLLELSAVNGNVYISMLQAYCEDVYYEAFKKELEENGITYEEHGMKPIQVPEIRF